jgi:hypothetical protein
VLFNLYAHCSRLLRLSDGKVVHLTGQQCPIHQSKVKQKVN